MSFYQDNYQSRCRRGVDWPHATQFVLALAASKYALCYDSAGRYWFTVRASDGRQVALTKGLKGAF